MVREIDDRYPEIARPYEPVKGGKHHKRIKLPPFTALIGTVLLMPLIYYPGTETSQPEPVTPESETVLAASMPEGEPHPRPVSPPAEKPTDFFQYWLWRCRETQMDWSLHPIRQYDPNAPVFLGDLLIQTQE